MSTVLEHPPLSNADWDAILKVQSESVSEEKKANHRANVVRVGPILPHPNADKLELTYVGGYQVVIGKGTMKEGDLAVYIQPDSVVPQTKPFEFIWKDQIGIDGIAPEKRRRITVRRFRGQYSEGLLLPLQDFYYELTENGQYYGLAYNNVHEGDDVSDALGITHWVPEFDRENTKADAVPLKSRPHRKYPKTLRGWFYWTLRKLGFRNAGGRSYALEVSFQYPEYDVDALKNARHGFEVGEPVIVTEKIHGSNARYVFVDGVFYAGSKTQWKQRGANVWWNAAEQHPEIEEWCTQNPGHVLYGEVGPTQKGFRYGADNGEAFFFAFDVYSPDGKWSWPGNEGIPSGICAPVIYVGPYSDELKKMADGESVVLRAKHIREGVVISARDRRRKLKVVSNRFLEADNAA